MGRFLGLLIVNLLVGFIAFFLVGYFGGPKWACMGFGYLAYLIAVNGVNTRQILRQKL